MLSVKVKIFPKITKSQNIETVYHQKRLSLENYKTLNLPDNLPLAFFQYFAEHCRYGFVEKLQQQAGKIYKVVGREYKQNRV